MDDLSVIQLNGYECISQGKRCSNNGGLITYIDQQFNYVLKMKLNTYKHWEGQIMQVNGGGLPQTITIGNIYQPPLNENYNEFLNQFTTVISSILPWGLLSCHGKEACVPL